jgi:putative addiction module component (TIGR02574 family)
MAQSSKASLPVDLLEKALGLSPDARLALATELLDSVEGSDPAWEQAWSRELDRRAAEADAHPEQGIPWSVARAQLEALVSPKP